VKKGKNVGSVPDYLRSDFIKMLTANLINSGSVFVATLLLIRIFDLESFAWIGSGLAYGFVLAKVLDSGLSFTALRYGARESNSLQCRPYVGVLYLENAALLLFFLFLVAIPVGDFASKWFFGKIDRPLLYLTVLTAGAVALNAAIRTDLQTRQKYGAILIYHLILSISRLVFIWLLWVDVIPQKAANGFVGLYLFPVIVASAIFTKMIFQAIKSSLLLKKKLLKVVREMFSYAPWVWLAGSLFVFALRAPVMVLGHLGEASQLAMFTAVLSFVSVIALVNDAARAVIIPRSVKFSQKEEYSLYIKKVNQVFCKVFFAMMVAVMVASAAVFLLLPKEYLPDSYFAFLVLATAMLTTTIFGATTTLIHSIGTPTVEAITNGVRALLILAGSYFIATVVNGGIVAQAIHAGFVLVTGEMILASYVRRHVANMNV
jgi:O-antigen/teichoic acid export membrane protein